MLKTDACIGFLNEEFVLVIDKFGCMAFLGRSLLLLSLSLSRAPEFCIFFLAETLIQAVLSVLEICIAEIFPVGSSSPAMS